MQHLMHEGHEEKGHAGLRRLEPGLADPCGHERMAPELELAQYREDRGAAAPTGLLAEAPESEDLAAEDLDVAESGERRRRSQTNQRNQDREERYHHGAPAPAGLLAAAPISEPVAVEVPKSGRALGGCNRRGPQRNPHALYGQRVPLAPLRWLAQVRPMQGAIDSTDVGTLSPKGQKMVGKEHSGLKPPWARHRFRCRPRRRHHCRRRRRLFRDPRRGCRHRRPPHRCRHHGPDGHDPLRPFPQIHESQETNGMGETSQREAANESL